MGLLPRDSMGGGRGRRPRSEGALFEASRCGPLSLAALGSCKTWRRPQGGTREAAFEAE